MRLPSSVNIKKGMLRLSFKINATIFGLTIQKSSLSMLPLPSFPTLIKSISEVLIPILESILNSLAFTSYKSFKSFPFSLTCSWTASSKIKKALGIESSLIKCYLEL